MSSKKSDKIKLYLYKSVLIKSIFLAGSNDTVAGGDNKAEQTVLPLHCHVS